MSAKILIPPFQKAPLRVLRRGPRIRMGTLWTRVRAAAYRNPEAWWLRLLGARISWRLRVDTPLQGSRKVEIGPAWRPRSAYIHVDGDAASADLHLKR